MYNLSTTLPKTHTCPFFWRYFCRFISARVESMPVKGVPGKTQENVKIQNKNSADKRKKYKRNKKKQIQASKSTEGAGLIPKRSFGGIKPYFLLKPASIVLNRTLPTRWLGGHCISKLYRHVHVKITSETGQTGESFYVSINRS